MSREGREVFKKRILQLIGDLDPGGAENVVVNLTKGLKAFNYKVAISSRKEGSLIQSLDGIPTFILSKKGLVDWRYLLTLCHIILKHKIDLIHSHLFGNNLYGFLAAVLTRRSTILTIHGEDCFNSKKRLLFYWLASPFVSKIVAVSKPLYRQLIEDLSIKKEKVVLIKNGIDTSLFCKMIDLNKKEKLGLPIKAPVIGAIGNIKPVKGYDTLLNAAVYISREVPEARFIIVGGAYQYEACFKDLKALTVEKGLQDKVYFLGKSDDVKDILHILDVYVLPSRSEGISIALLEAMASGRPIVATKVGGTPDIIEDGNTGLLIPPEDPSSLASAIIQLLKNKSLSKSLGQQAKLVAEKEFNVNSMVEKYSALYNEVLKC